MHLIQLLLPLFDNDGNAFPPEMYQQIRDELTEKFDGLTAYNRAPAEGVWKSGSQKMSRDEIVIFEIMADELDATWWGNYRTTLEKNFRQEHLIIRAETIQLL